MASSKAAMSMPSTEAGPGWPTWFHTKSSPLKRLAVRRTMRRAKSSWRRSATMPVRAAARRGDLADHRVDTGRIDVHHPYLRALAGEADRAGPAHPGRRRRDDADFIFEPHGSTLLPVYSAAATAARRWRFAQQQQQRQADDDDHHHQLEIVDIGDHRRLARRFGIERGEAGRVGQAEGRRQMRHPGERVVGPQMLDEARMHGLGILGQQRHDNRRCRRCCRYCASG